VRDVVRGLMAPFAQPSSRLRDRLDTELPPFLVSLIVHGLLIIGLGLAGYQAHQETQRQFTNALVDNVVSSESTFQDLDQPALLPPPEAMAGSSAPTLKLSTVLAPNSAEGDSVSAASEDSRDRLAPQFARLDVRRATEMILPNATTLAQNVSVRGNGAEQVGGVEKAVDRIATEIMRRLELGRTLVVWAFDASGSLQAERQRLAKHIETVYTHINQLAKGRLWSNDGLLTMVVSFGSTWDPLLAKPTADGAKIVNAIDRVPLDRTGIERTFTAVAGIIHRWGVFKDSRNHGYYTMVIVVTDEIGDDEE
jgi:hypothetical protein